MVAHLWLPKVATDLGKDSQPFDLDCTVGPDVQTDRRTVSPTYEDVIT